MKKTTLVIMFISTAILSNRANAQNSATESATASVTLITPISISNTTNLNFGTFVASEIPGTITMTPSGAVTVSGGVTQINGGDVSVAAFTVAGETGQSYAITLPSEVILSSGTEEHTGGQFLTLNSFTSNPSGSGEIGIDGTISVGGTLTVPANSQAGTYTGSFEVAVNYN